jgi:hypothetical protein
MGNRYFHLRLTCTYKGDKNDVNDLAIEVLNNDKWETLDLSIRSPGFLQFVNALFSCQHLYMRVNSAERGLILISATGEIQVETGEFWDIRNASITFHAKLKSGTPTEDDLNYITDRMTHCPVSTNIAKHIKIKNAVYFE